MENTMTSKGVLTLVFVYFLIGSIAIGAPQEQTRLMRYPDISRDSVVFVYAGDLWICGRAGGSARRLTGHPGSEIFPKFSPDGKWIAFTGEYDGNQDVYVIPSEGGEPRRLTFHPANDMVLGWTPNGKKILFRSDRYDELAFSYAKLFLVSPEGGMPQELPIPRASLTTFSPDGTRIAFLPTSQEFRHWKRYRGGGWSPAIGIYDLTNNKYEELPKTNGMDLFPMWHGDKIYFISDRDSVMNLYHYDLESKQTKKLTEYKEYDIKWPSLGSDAIVYENGGLLYSFDLATEKVSSIPVLVNSDDLLARSEIKTVAGNIGSFALSPSGVRAVFEARGNLFTLPVEHGSARNLTDSSSVHELNPAWSPDGKWIAYLSDRTGEYELYLRPQKGGNETRITTDGGVYRYGPMWSPDTKKLLYWDKKLRLWYVDIEEKKPVLIDTGGYAEVKGGTWSFADGGINGGSWSPDSRWVAYNKPIRPTAGFIYLYSLEQKKSFPVSSGFYSDTEPQFDPSGKYLYFLSQRFFYPSAGQLDNRYNYYCTDGVFVVTLRADDPSPFGAQSDEEKSADRKKDGEETEAPQANTGAGSDKAENKADETTVKPIRIDTTGIQNRITSAPIPAGIYSNLRVRRGKVFYLSVPMEATQVMLGATRKAMNVLHVFDATKREDKVLLDGIVSYDLDRNGDKVIYNLGDNNYAVADAVPGKVKVGDGTLNTQSLQVQINPREEWRQIFHEAWRIERDFYWDPAMGGLDWEIIGKRYEALLPWVVDRDDLNYILGEMIGELSTSHAYVGGGDKPEPKRIGVGLLGVDFDVNDGFYRFKKIYPGENWNEQTRSPLTEVGLSVEQGNYLIAVNGKAARPPTNIYSFFQNLDGQIVTLKINDKPSTEGAWDILVKPIGSEAGVRYLDWVENNRRIVAEATGGRVGYMHVPDTSFQGIALFDKQFNGELGKDGMIVDERYNHGGQTPDFYIEKLLRHLLTLEIDRESKDRPFPPVAIYGPKVMIVNELAGSGGDTFPWFFHREKIGPIVGKRTWGGLVGIPRIIPLRDNGFVTAPEHAFWSTDNGGEWIVENQGVEPDYDVDQRPDLVIAGHDPQLEKAIEVVKEALKSYPPLPPRPKYPKKN
jgi:tricorn protease